MAWVVKAAFDDEWVYVMPPYDDGDRDLGLCKRYAHIHLTRRGAERAARRARKQHATKTKVVRLVPKGKR